MEINYTTTSWPLQLDAFELTQIEEKGYGLPMRLN